MVAGRAALLGISLTLNDFGPDDVPDITPRSLDELVSWANSANEHRDRGRFAQAGRDLGVLLTELQAHALTAGSGDHSRGFTALVQSCILAGDVAQALAGNADLAISAARRAYDMARRCGDPGLMGFRSVAMGASPDAAHRAWAGVAGPVYRDRRTSAVHSPAWRGDAARGGAWLCALGVGAVCGTG